MRHARLVEAITKETSKLSTSISGMTSSSARGRNIDDDRTSPIRLDDLRSEDQDYDDCASLKRQISHVDQLMMIENRILLWNRLLQVIKQMCHE